MTKIEQIIPITGELIALTPDSASTFFGFYDICPWSYQQNELVVLSVPKDFQKMPHGEPADVVVWNIDTNVSNSVGHTQGWNWQHGARQQWLKNGSILYNDVIQGAQFSKVVDKKGGLINTFEMTVSALHPNETYGVSTNYAKLAKYYSAYGYASAHNDHIGEKPSEDGLWRVDLQSGKVDLLLSYAEICETLSLEYSPSMFVSHPDFSPSGKYVEFFLIQEGGAGTSFMRLLVFNTDTNVLSLITDEKASHPAWIDDAQLWSWARESSAMKALSRSGLLTLPGMSLLARLVRKFHGKARNALLSEGFFIYNVISSKKKIRVAPQLLIEDGHFSRHPHKPLMLGDTYPNEKGYLTLVLFSLETNVRVEVAKIYHGVVTALLSLRCDLHPRWNRDGTQISVDLSWNGVRHVAIFDATKAIAELDISTT